MYILIHLLLDFHLLFVIEGYVPQGMYQVDMLDHPVFKNIQSIFQFIGYVTLWRPLNHDPKKYLSDHPVFKNVQSIFQYILVDWLHILVETSNVQIIFQLIGYITLWRPFNHDPKKYLSGPKSWRQNYICKLYFTSLVLYT